MLSLADQAKYEELKMYLKNNQSNQSFIQNKNPLDFRGKAFRSWLFCVFQMLTLTYFW